MYNTIAAPKKSYNYNYNIRNNKVNLYTYKRINKGNKRNYCIVGAYAYVFFGIILDMSLRKAFFFICLPGKANFVTFFISDFIMAGIYFVLGSCLRNRNSYNNYTYELVILTVRPFAV